MSTTAATTLSIATATALIKKAVDDVYDRAKEKAINIYGIKRADIKDEAIATHLYNITRVKTIWNFDKAASLYEFYYPSRILTEGGHEKSIESLDDIGKGSNFVIQGTAGQGKSIFLRYLCGQELGTKNGDRRVPIFIELRRLSQTLTVQDLILEALERCQLPNSPACWKAYADSKKFVLLMDAFDEIDPPLVSKALSDIERISELFAHTLQIIITARPDANIQRSNFFKTIRLAPLHPNDHNGFLKKICEDIQQAENIENSLENSSTDIKHLLTTPLMMTLLVLLYKSTQNIPDTLPRFYEELFDVLFFRHDQSKPGFKRTRYTNVEDSTLKKLFAAFCFYFRLAKHSALGNAAFAGYTSEASKVCNAPIEPEKFKNELTKTVCLILEDGLEYSFIHRSVAQYYAAAFISKSSEEFKTRFYQMASKQNNYWSLELKFLNEIDDLSYARFYEIPLLDSALRNLNTCIDTINRDTANEINKYLFSKIKIHLMPRRNDANEIIDHNFGIGMKSSDDFGDPVVASLSDIWIKHLIKKINTPPSSAKILSKFATKSYLTTGKNHYEFSGEIAYSTITEAIPDLGENIVIYLVKRYKKASNIIKIESEKIRGLGVFTY